MNTNYSDTATEPLTLVIAATFVAEPLEQPLTFWMQELDMPARVVFAPYNQIFQQLLDPSSLLATNDNGINVVLVRLEDWQMSEPGAPGKGTAALDADQQIERNVQDLIHALITAVERSRTPYLLCLCPASVTKTADLERARFCQVMEDLVKRELAAVDSVSVITTTELAATYPVAIYDNPYTDQLAHIPYTPVFYTALGTMVARKVHALKSAGYKVIVLDCDQTLWGGICGEGGPLEIQIDPVRAAIQAFMVQQHAAGMLLCLCSKNNEEDVIAVFDCRLDMVLKREHIVAWRLNWRPKSENIKSLAQELQLGLDSIIFLDDDPLECAEVQANCPEVLTLQLPRNPDMIPTFLRNVWIFDHLQITKEGKSRTALYQQNTQRERFRQETPTLQEFLAGLDLQIHVAALMPHQLTRVSELTQRTNQFNLTTMRRSEAELQDLCRPGGAECFTVHVTDRFGDYGLVGVMIFMGGSTALTVDTFLLSCRALGRGVEHRMLAKLGEIAQQRGLDHIDILYSQTKRNRPALDFLDSVGAEVKEPSDAGYLFRFPAVVAAAIRYSPHVAERPIEMPPEQSVSEFGLASSATDTRIQAALLSAIATELHDAEQINTVIAAQTQPRPSLNTTIVAPRTAVEKKVADIWTEVLGLDLIGVDDNFFDLGGHSLLAMQILSRLRTVFQVELSPRLLVTSEFTVAALAKTVLKEQLRQVSPQEMTTLLRQIEEFSDDEIKTALGVKREAI